ncbi:MAG TPA: hypothetical protein VN924_20985 [Bryobacteraceae bacterium]|nr:hypothetical protein [Bryobacteraceae bacterium]
MYSPIAKTLGARLATSLLFAGAACSRSYTVSTPDGKVGYKEKGKDGGTLTVTGKDGQTATLSFNQNKAPDDYPKDVPICNPAKVVLSHSVSDKNARNLMLESPDASDKIVDFYKKALDGNGWKTATKDQREVVLQITDSGGKRGVMQVVADRH